MTNEYEPSTQVEFEMIVDRILLAMPALIQLQPAHAKILMAKYKALIEAGFTEQQALELVKTRPLVDQ